MHEDCLRLKMAAMQVLSEAGPAGLNVVEIAKRIQRQGLRDLRTAKSPEVTQPEMPLPLWQTSCMMLLLQAVVACAYGDPCLRHSAAAECSGGMPVQASVAAALSRDVVFGRPAPATYCLASFLNAASM